jgi:hypothetical protein
MIKEKPYFFFGLRKFSSAVTILGLCGKGALISKANPASSTALMVFSPKAAIFVEFCLYLGKFSIKLLIPPGVKKQMMS